jgi:tRNA(Arg) A34 adenosine deaminase TadA
VSKKQHVVKAVIYDKRGNVIGQAVNNYRKSHPIQAHFAQLAGEDHRIFLHAEIAALLKCGTRRPHRIFISRVTKEGPKLAAPCPVCRLALEHWGVKRIEYT